MSVIDNIIESYRFEFADTETLIEIQNSIRYRCPGDINFLDPEDALAFKLKFQ